MPILDKLSYFHHHEDDTALTPSTSGVLGAHSLDCGSRGYGRMAGVTNFSARISEAVTGATAVTLELINADNEALTENVNVIATVVKPAAECAVGAVLSGKIPSFKQRFLGVRVKCTGTLTAGKVDRAYFSDDPGYDGDLL